MSDWIFIHSVIDDMGLSAAEFRVYAHLAGRRADKSGVAYPGIQSIARVCRLNRGTVEKVLNALEARQLITRERVPGDMNRYRFPTPPTFQEVPLKTGVPQTEVRELPGFEVQEVPGTEGHKGNPVKVIPQRANDVTSAAEAIYDAYPRKIGRKAALATITKALRETTSERLLESVRRYAASVANWREEDRRFIPHPATWFRQGRYEDDAVGSASCGTLRSQQEPSVRLVSGF